MENHINPEDLREFMNIHQNTSTTKSDVIKLNDSGYADTMVRKIFVRFRIF